ncbi:MAG: hypothetical protein ABSD10_01265 [Candidatus Saccharimonadales bacterium]|jgi:hypothetical protein
MAYETTKVSSAEAPDDGIIARLRKLAAGLFGFDPEQKKIDRFNRKQRELIEQEVARNMVSSAFDGKSRI